MRARWIIALTAVLAWSSFPGAAQTLTEDERALLRHATRREQAGWISLHIEGEPRQRGFQYGYLLAREIGESMKATARVWTYESGMEWAWFIEKGAGILSPRVDRESREELEGLAEGLRAAGITTTLEELIAYNGYIEINSYWWPIEKERLGARAPTPRKESCSSFIATGSATADGRIVLGHNTMTGYQESDMNVILDIAPSRGHRILMQTSPGWIHSGSDFFITDAGLVGSETTIGGFRGFDEEGVPEFVRMRRATQDAASIDEWCAIMREGNNGGYANAWLIGDVNTNEIARLELGLHEIGFERKRDGWFSGSNVAEDLRLLRFETQEHETDIRASSVARRVRWKHLLDQNYGRITADAAKGFLADHVDTYLGKEHPDDRTLCSHNDLQGEPWQDAPFDPWGAVDAKVVDARMAHTMTIAARWGSGCGMAFDAAAFLALHPQFEWMRGVLKDRPAQPWVEFTAGQ